MENVEIYRLKTEYLRMVTNNQGFYNPDGNGELDEAEIGKLMRATGVKDVNELLQPVDEKEDLARRIANGIHVKKVVTDGKLDGTYTGTAVGAGTGGVGVGVEGGTLQGDISRTIEMDFYEGQLITDVKESVFKDCFRDLDLNHNGQLSAGEIESYKNYLKLLETNEKLHSDLEHYNSEIKDPIKKGVVVTLLGSAIGTILPWAVLRKLLNTVEKHYDWSNKLNKYAFDKPKYQKIGRLLSKGTPNWENYCLNTGFSKGTILAGALIGTCLAGFGVYKYIKKHYAESITDAKKRKPQLEIDIKNSDIQINKLKEQYSHIYG